MKFFKDYLPANVGIAEKFVDVGYGSGGVFHFITVGVVVDGEQGHKGLFEFHTGIKG
jgi:hypothetical protein